MRFNHRMRCRAGKGAEMKYRLAIFDLDGTVLNTLEDLAAATNAALEKNGMPARTIDEVRQMVGNGIHKLCERAVPGVRTAAPRSRSTATLLNGTAYICTTAQSRMTE